MLTELESESHLHQVRRKHSVPPTMLKWDEQDSLQDTALSNVLVCRKPQTRGGLCQNRRVVLTLQGNRFPQYTRKASVK